MGMTLWIRTLEGRSMSRDSDDHSLMHRHAEELDALCQQQGLAPLSSYFDLTDLNYCLDDEFADEGDDDVGPPLDPETGLGYGIDDMQWFDAAAGLEVLTRLHEALASGALPSLKPAARRELLEELAHSRTVLEAPARNGARFHLAVIL